jgi:Flp pilus assembly protein TadG
MLRLTSKVVKKQRRGVIAVLAAFLLVALLGMVSFSVDIGYLTLARAQLQTAADSAALAAAGVVNDTDTTVLAVAKQFAGYHTAAGRKVTLLDSDVVYGTWDATTRTFTESSSVGSAIKVTVRTSESSGGNTALFFGKLFGVNSIAQSASAIATVNPRDICFVVDLSASMNDNTDPDNAASYNSTYASDGYGTIGTELIQNVFDDFGFGTYSTSDKGQCAGYPLTSKTYSSVSSCLSAIVTKLTNNSTYGSAYNITSAEAKTSAGTRKAYNWIMDYQIKTLRMPAATPTPNSTSTTSYYYWKTYIDNYYSRLGYVSYVKFMMDYASTGTIGSSGLYTPLSLKNTANCPLHSESTAGGTFSFPPREMPTHAGRRAVIAALELIKELNANISDTNQRDWVSIVAFEDDTTATNSTVKTKIIRHSLDSDYDSAMSACTQLQACYSNTGTQTGLIVAANLLKPTTDGGSGRTAANKVVVLLTDGVPNVADTSLTQSQVSSYIAAHPSSYYYNTSAKWMYDACLIETAELQSSNWCLYPVGIGLSTDSDFMNRLSHMGGSTSDAPTPSGNPAEYESVVTTIFKNILTNPKLRIVQ